MLNYELMYVIPGKLTEEEKKSISTKVDSLIKENDGSVISHNEWLTRKLSYPIQNTRQGTFVLARLSLPLESLAKLNRELILEESILRHQIVKIIKNKQVTPNKPTIPKVLPQEAIEALNTQHTDTKESVPEVPVEVSAEQLEEKLEKLLNEEKPVIK